MNERRKIVISCLLAFVMLAVITLPAFTQVTIRNFGGTSWTFTDDEGDTLIIRFSANGRQFTLFLNGARIFDGSVQVEDQIFALVILNTIVMAGRFVDNTMHMFTPDESDGQLYMGPGERPNFIFTQVLQ